MPTFADMQQFSDLHISIASTEDVAAITELLNGAYRGESSKQGWTTEADLISGNTRTDDSEIRAIMQQRDSVFLKFSVENEVVGCVNLQKHGNRLYLGMFSVSPKLQAGGIGKKLLRASEEYAKRVECSAIYMSVISVRAELIDWYQRHGYKDTGERKAFIEDNISGKHLQQLEFMILEKPLP